MLLHFFFFHLFFFENPPGLPGTGPGTARQRKQGQGRKGREGRKERGRKERACGAERSGPAARMDGWIDGQRREQEIERREGGLWSRQNQKREDNERVAWTAVVAVCFIDRTW